MFFSLLLPALLAADPLPNTKPLDDQGDLAMQMVGGIHKYLDREIADSAKLRAAKWKVETTSPEAYEQSVEPNRGRFKKMLGLIDERVKFADLEIIAGPNTPAVIAENEKVRVYAVRWPVLPGVTGEGLLLEPKGKVLAQVVAIPDSEWSPEALCGMVKEGESAKPYALLLAQLGCRVVVPTLIDRGSEFSGNTKLNRKTNVPHREFIYRMAYEMGRSLVGLEVQKVLAVVDWMAREKGHAPVGVIGAGQGGQIAFYAAAADPRIQTASVCGYFSRRENVWKEPIDRNLWGQLLEFGDAEIAQLVLPRELLVEPGAGSENVRYSKGYWGEWTGPCPDKQVGQAALGSITAPPADEVVGEVARWQKLAQLVRKGEGRPGTSVGEGIYNAADFFAGLTGARKTPVVELPGSLQDKRKGFSARERLQRQFDELVAFNQKLWRDSEPARNARFAKCDFSSPEKYDKSAEPIRDFFWQEVIGKLPKPTLEANPRSRVIYDEPKWTGYEIMLDLYPDVYAYGILLMPKGMKEGEKRPVVVCQHGLEGRPTDICNPKEKTRYYNSFGAQLADRGYIVFAPQNPYIGRDTFRQLQRKANPLKLSLFSFIIRQHERILDWLETVPNVDKDRMAFYGLSYGGKTAVRVPAVLKKYCLSICSGDFNEWIGKNVSVTLDRSYMWTIEYEMYEFDLGNTFNYAEMAYLIAPRPFMVERGHDDGVGLDDMVAYEFAKVRYLYANRLKIPHSAEIEFFAGGHEINGKGTFDFLARHLKMGKRD